MSVFTGDIHKKHSYQCTCGMTHSSPIGMTVIREGALEALPEVLEHLELGKNILVVTDSMVYDIIGWSAIEQWEKAGLNIKKHVFPLPLIPDERALGIVMVAATKEIDAIVCLGGGMTAATNVVHGANLCPASDRAWMAARLWHKQGERRREKGES